MFWYKSIFKCGIKVVTFFITILHAYYKTFIRNRNNRSQKFFKISVLKNFAIYTGKKLWWGLFLKTKAHLSKQFVLFVSMKALLKWWKMPFISSEKLFSFSRYLNLCFNFFAHLGKTAWLKISNFMMSQHG